MALPKKGVAYTDYIPLIDTLDPTKFKVNPTIAEGDFKISKDGGDYEDLTTVPVVTPTGSRTVKISLSATEMDADNVNVQAIDVIDNEWQEVIMAYDTNDVVNIVSGVLDALSDDHLIPGSIGKIFDELYKLQGMKLGKPMTVTRTSRVVDDITLELTGDGQESTTVTRQ